MVNLEQNAGKQLYLPINVPPNNYDPQNAILLQYALIFSKTYAYLMFNTVVAIVYHTTTVQSSVLRSSAFNSLTFNLCAATPPSLFPVCPQN